nr:hypothetical protein [Limosilactobacillus mucosae]
MNLYRVTLDGWLDHLVVAASKEQAVSPIVEALNWRVTANDITYQTTDFYAKKIDIDSIKKPTIID